MTFVVVLTLMLLSGPIAGQEKGETYTIVIPFDRFETVAGFFKDSYAVNIMRNDGDSTSVSGDPEWRMNGFPSLLAVELRNAGEWKKKNRITITPAHTEVDARLADKTKVRLRFVGLQPDEIGDLFAAITIKGANDSEPVATYIDQVYDALAEKAFSGPLADLSRSKQHQLLNYAHQIAGGTSVGTDVFKFNYYLTVNTPQSAAVYNSLKLNQNQRIADVINQQILGIKNFARLVEGAGGVYGLKVIQPVYHKPFSASSHSVTPISEILTIIVSGDLIRRFNEHDITSQELIDGSYVIVDDFRIKVYLAQ